MVKKCDICGCEYTAEPYKRTPPFSNILYTDQLVLKRNMIDGGQLPPEEYEMCRKCRISLGKWMQRREYYERHKQCNV